MVNAGILDGDQIFVQCCQEAYNGQIVVALIDDSATVKRFYKERITSVCSRKTIRWIRSS